MNEKNDSNGSPRSEVDSLSELPLGRSDAPAAQSCTVLFVDNSPEVRQSAKASLDAAGYSVLLAADGYEALASVVQSRPDIVLAGVMMPRLDGYQMCALIKSNSDYQRIPVIMLSSKDGQFDRERAQLVGSDAHVPKPFTAEALITALKAAHQNCIVQASTL